MSLIHRTQSPHDDDNDENHVSNQLPDVNFDERRFPASLFGHRVATASSGLNIEQLLRSMDNLEIYCDAPEESLYISTPSCTIDISLEEALSFPQKISPRLPVMPTGTSSTRQITLSNLKMMWCRQIAHYFEWVAGIPELRLMGMRERIKLVIRQTCAIIGLNISYRTYLQSHNGLIFDSGISFDHSEILGDETLCNYLNAMTDVIQRSIVSVFRKISITRAEFLLMKLILMFNASNVPFPPGDRLVIESALRRYQSALVSHVKNTYSSLGHDVVTARISALFGLMPSTELMAEIDEMHLSHITIRNNGNMLGRLTNEIHASSSADPIYQWY